jgi:O-methyltransferase
MRGYELSRTKMTFPIELTDEDKKNIDKCKPFTMIGYSRMICNVISMKYIEANNIEGDVVETGIWRGGSLGLLALTAFGEGKSSRTFWGFDTFQGMPIPGQHDEDFAHRKFQILQESNGYSDWCKSSKEEVLENLRYMCSSLNNFRLIEGKVEETLTRAESELRKISILRIDTDWYSSTKVALEFLYSRVSKGGVIIIDDYEAWEGSKKATDEFFHDKFRPLLLPFGSSRLFVKID